MSEAWKHKIRENDKYLGFSEINAGQGISGTILLILRLASGITKEIELPPSRITGIYENEKNLRISNFSNSINYRRKKLEIIITTGVENEKRIKDMIDNESS